MDGNRCNAQIYCLDTCNLLVFFTNNWISITGIPWKLCWWYAYSFLHLIHVKVLFVLFVQAVFTNLRLRNIQILSLFKIHYNVFEYFCFVWVPQFLSFETNRYYISTVNQFIKFYTFGFSGSKLWPKFLPCMKTLLLDFHTVPTIVYIPEYIIKLPFQSLSLKVFWLLLSLYYLLWE